MLSILILTALLITAILATVVTVARDGYHRVPPRRPQREFERAEAYRAWSGRA